MDHSVNAPQAAPNPVVEWVWYEGTDALMEGEAVCYNTDYGTAANVDGRRGNRVERPSTSNNRAFAGVAARDYAARSTGQLIEIYCPGSKGVNIAVGANTTINTGSLTFQVGGGTGAGRFVSVSTALEGGWKGRGTAIPRQTQASVILESNFVNGWSLDTAGTDLTVASTTGIAAGDIVVLVASEDEGSSKIATLGKHTISAVPDATSLTLSATAVDATPGAALTVSGYVYSGSALVQADLLDGDESGGVYFCSLPNTGTTGMTYAPGGVNYIPAGVTIATADADFTLADGEVWGEKVAFWCLGTLTTSDACVDLVTAGVQGDGATALAEINSIDAAGDAAILEWAGVWRTLAAVGGATQA